MAKGNIYRKISAVWTCGLWDTSGARARSARA